MKASSNRVGLDCARCFILGPDGERLQQRQAWRRRCCFQGKAPSSSSPPRGFARRQIGKEGPYS